MSATVHPNQVQLDQFFLNFGKLTKCCFPGIPFPQPRSSWRF